MSQFDYQIRNPRVEAWKIDYNARNDTIAYPPWLIRALLHGEIKDRSGKLETPIGDELSEGDWLLYHSMNETFSVMTEKDFKQMYEKFPKEPVDDGIPF